MHPRSDLGTPAIRLRPTTPADLAALFAIQSDVASNEMAGTKARPREVFFAVWEKHFADPRINGCVIEMDGKNGNEVVGSIACFQAEERDNVGYWIARAHWGKGIASRALALFLELEKRRPLHATTARSNATSQRILVRCGFRFVEHHMGEETERYLAREISEFVLD